MPYKDVFQFDSIVVIESLPTSKMPTSEWLFESYLQPIANKDGHLKVELFQAATKTQLMEFLERVYRQYAQRGHSPILHLEAHGDDAGMELASGEHVAWERIREPLTAINEMVGVNLLVVSTLCNGGWMSTLLNPAKPAPAWGVIGPLETVYAGPLREAMAAFYSVLISTKNARTAMNAMNEYVKVGEWTYRLETAELMLFRSYTELLERHSSDEQMQDEENQIVEEVVRRRGYDINIAIEARTLARETARDHRKYFEFFRRSFFMLDRFPENADRFKLTFDECLQITRSIADGPA
jgi:hypothetical protein